MKRLGAGIRKNDDITHAICTDKSSMFIVRMSRTGKFDFLGFR